MRRHKRWMPVCAFLLTLAVLLSACVGSGKPAAEETGGTKTDTETNNAGTEVSGKSAGSGEQIELVWMTRPPDNEEQEKIRREQVIEPFERAYPHIKLKLVETQDPDMLTRQQLAAGAGPDIIVVDGPTTLMQFASAGYLKPLDEYAAQYGWNERFYDWALDTGVYEDKLYGLPGAYESLVVWYNKEMFQANGWEEPKNFDEFMRLNEKIQQSGKIPFAFGTTEFRAANEWWLSLVYNSYLGPEEFKKVLKNEVPWTSDLIKEATQLWVDIWKKGYINEKQSHAISSEDAWYLIYNQKAAMIMEGTWALDRLVTNPPPFEMDFFIMPGWREGVEPTLPMALGEAIGINSKTKYPDETAAFIDFYYGMERAKSELERGTFLPVNGLKIDDVQVKSPLVKKVYEELNQAFAEGKTGYASWTYWPPKAQQFLWDNIDAVFLDAMTVDQYLQKAQEKAEEDAADGMLFRFSD